MNFLLQSYGVFFIFERSPCTDGWSALWYFKNVIAAAIGFILRSSVRIFRTYLEHTLWLSALYFYHSLTSCILTTNFTNLDYMALRIHLEEEKEHSSHIKGQGQGLCTQEDIHETNTKVWLWYDDDLNLPNLGDEKCIIVNRNEPNQPNRVSWNISHITNYWRTASCETTSLIQWSQINKKKKKLGSRQRIIQSNSNY